MPIKPSTPAVDTTIQKIPLNKIIPSPFQTRKDFDPQKLQELASTLKAHGLLNAIVVRKAGAKFELIAGERRVRAAKSLGWTEIDAKIQDVDDKEAAQQVVVENLQRDDLNPIEQAEGYKKLQDLGMSMDQIANKVGVGNKATISRYLALLELPQEIQKMLPRGNISETHTRAIRQLKGAQQQISFARQVDREGWSVKETERRVGEILQQNGKKPTAAAKPKVRKTPDVRWEGEEIVIYRHFRPVEETLDQFLAQLRRLINPMLLTMPGLKDTPKSARARADAMQQAAQARNVEAQVLVDEAFSKMSAAQIKSLQKQFKEGSARADRENAASAEKVRAQMEKDLQG